MAAHTSVTQFPIFIEQLPIWSVLDIRFDSVTRLYVPGIIDSRYSENYGNYKISGTVRKGGVLAKHEVILFIRLGMIPVKRVLSDPETGAYLFDRLPYREKGFLILCREWPTSGSLADSVVHDFITPELMT